MIDIDTVRKILFPQFGYLAKSTGELLYAHHFITFSIFNKLVSFIPSLNEKEKELLSIACLVHDIGKMDEKIQQGLKDKEKSKIPHHKITSTEDFKKYFEKCNLQLDDKDIKFIADIVRTHHGVSERDLKEINTSVAGFYTQILTTCDWLASLDYVSFDTLVKLRKIYNDIIEFTAVQCSRFFSPSYAKIIDIVVKYYKEKGWVPVCFPEDGVIFISSKNTELPQKEKIINEILLKIINESLKLYSPMPNRADREFLVSIVKYFPVEFLETHKDKIIDNLSNIDSKGFIFLKYINDLFKLLKSDIEEKETIRLLRKACGSSGSLKTQAKKEFKQMFNKDVGNPKEILVELFNYSKLDDIIPKNILQDISISEKWLKNLKPVELYNILYTIAKKIPTAQLKNDLYEYLSSIILMEEEVDFRKIALDIFEKYKNYKKTSDAQKGCCEICGCPVADKMQPALNLSRTPQAFSQIKAKYGYRSICFLCSYDNLILRKDTSPNKIRIYLKIKSKVTDLFLNYNELKLLIDRISSAVRNVRRIERFQDRKEFHNIPLPENLEIPVSDIKNDVALKEVLMTEDSILFKLEDVKKEEFSPKDMKAKYEVLYHIMKLIGFKVAIGAEEQEGLFGETIETNSENYYKSLIMIILAKLNEKKSKKYIFAKNLLEKAPSITIKIIDDYIQDKNLSENLIKCLIKGMINAKIIIARR